MQLTGIQLIFTDGITSPLFETARKDEPTSYKIDTEKRISTIKIKSSRDTNYYLDQLTLETSEGYTVVAGKKYYEQNEDPFMTQQIRENEAFIGLYGVKSKKYWITSLGFILWDTKSQI